MFATPEYGKGDPRRKTGDITIRMGATASFIKAQRERHK
jgi:hypothetical protein